MIYKLRYRLLCYCQFLLFFVATVQAQNVISISSGSGHPGDEVELNLFLHSSVATTALQVEIPLPDYINYVEGSAFVNPERMTDNHQFSVSQAEGCLKFYIYSLALEPIPGNEGQLLSFRLRLGKVPSVNELKPIVVLSDAQGQSVPTTVQNGQVTILCPQIMLSEHDIHFGRVPIRGTYTKQIEVSNTGNEPLTLSDYSSTNNHFTLSQFPLTITSGEKQLLTITYAPIPYGDENGRFTLLSNAINGSQTVRLDASPYSVNVLSTSDAIGNSDEEVTLSVNMQNMESIVAAQCSFVLPEVLQYVDGSARLNASRTDNTHQISCAQVDGVLSFYIHSTENRAILDNDGELFTFRLRLNGTGGTYDLPMEAAILSNLQGENMISDYAGSSIRIAAPRLTVEEHVEFGDVPMEVPAKKTCILTNSGETPLMIQRIEFTNEAFSIEGPDLSTIESGESKDVVIVYQPEKEGEFSGTMQIYSNDPDNRMQIVELHGTVYPTNQLFVEGEPLEGNANQYVLTISLFNSQPIVALQFDIHWMEGMVTQQESLLQSSRIENHIVNLSCVNNDTYRVFIYSLDNEPIAIGNGPLLSIIYNKVENTTQYSGTTVMVDNVILSTIEEQNCASELTTTFQVFGLKGDANDDGIVTVTDIVSIVDYLLERPQPKFIKAQADMNDDGIITISDITNLIYFILHNNN